MNTEHLEVLHGERRWCVIHGELEDVLPTLPERCIDVACADPPYSKHVHASVRSSGRRDMPDASEYGCRTRRTVDLGFDYLTPKTRWAMLRGAVRLVKRWSMFFGDERTTPLWRLGGQAAGLDYVRTLYWDRVNAAPQFTGDRPANACEMVTMLHPRGRKRWNGGGKAGIYRCPIVQNRGGKTPRLHETQKPEELIIAILADFSEPNEVVLDCCAGSGTCGVAALRLGRRVILVERDAKWAEVCRERLTAEEQNSTLAARRAGQIPMFG